MNVFKKQMSLATCQNQDERMLAEKIFQALDRNVIDYEPLAISLSDLEIEKFIPSGLISEFLKQVNVRLLRQSAVIFDLYIPSKRWVTNFTEATAKCDDYQEYLEGAVLLSVSRLMSTVYGNPDLDLIAIGDTKTSLKAILCQAVKAWLKKNQITHPLDDVSELRCPGQTKGTCILPHDSVDTFISRIKK